MCIRDRFYDVCLPAFARCRLYDIRINCTLCKPNNILIVLCLFLKDFDKGFANYFSFEIETSLNNVNQVQLKEPHLVQFYNRFATYNGSNPYKTPGMMTLVQHLEQYYGTYIPKKGIGDISASLYKLAKRMGVEFHLNSSVAEILIENKKAVGVRTKEKKHCADLVVSNMDIVPTYNKLHKPENNLKKNIKENHW